MKKKKPAQSRQAKRGASGLDPRLKLFLEKDEIDDTVVHDFSLFGKAGADFLLDVACDKIRLAPYPRGNAVILLGLLKEERAIETLIHLLQEKEERLRTLAVCAIGRIGTDSARAALRTLFRRKNASLAETSCAIDFLGKIGKKEDVKALQDFMKRTDYPPFMAKVQAVLQRL